MVGFGLEIPGNTAHLKTSEVWISPSIFFLHWADGLLGKIIGLMAQIRPAAQLSG
jgi:hypothetical protein